MSATGLPDDPASPYWPWFAMATWVYDCHELQLWTVDCTFYQPAWLNIVFPIRWSLP